MTERVIGRFIKVLRGAEIPVSTAETLDAVQVVALIGYQDRTALKQALSLVLAKSEADKVAFDDCFDAFFRFDGIPPTPAADPPPSMLERLRDLMSGQQGGAGAGASSSLGQQLLSEDNAALDRQMAQAAQAVGLDNIRVITQKGLYGRRIMQAMGAAALDQEILQLEQDGGRQQQQLAARLRGGRDQLRQAVREYVADQFVLQAREHGRQLREQMIREASLRTLAEFRDVRVLVEKMARRLARKHGRRQRRARRGQLDGRRTTVMAVRHGGVPASLVWRRKRIQKPKLMVICDVSSSVSAAARFLLMFLYAVNDVVPSVRSFAFASRFGEVTDLFRLLPSEQAIAEVMDRYAGSGTDYGTMLRQFLDLAEQDLDQRTTVIILGDARNNDLPAEQQLLAHVGRRCKQLYWLNPESTNRWGSGDSVMPLYQPYCRAAVSCSTLAGLERFVDRLMRDMVRA
ncbi:MAG: VWA domain-containing protein [Alcanivoracaceae bacterium]